MSVYLCAKFEFFSIILTTFRRGIILPTPSPPQNEPLKIPPRLGLIKDLLFVIAIFSRNAWVIPLKDKKGVSIVNAFQKL